MKLRKTHSTQVDQYVRELIRKEHPETVERVISLVKQEHVLSEDEILNIAYHAGLRFTKHSTSSVDFKHYVATANARWYWLIITLSTLTAIIVLILPEVKHVIYLRYLLGSVFVLWMPGYCFVKNLFPREKLEKPELIALSLGINIVLVPMIALVLHYTPWGITTTPVTIILLILTQILATLAIFREYQDLPKRSLLGTCARTTKS